MARLACVTLLILSAAVAASAQAQDVASVELRIESLRSQLRDLVDKEAALRARLDEVEEALRPENVERSVAAVGTTDARALREQRREQLEKQKGEVEEQMRALAARRAEIESSITAFEAEAVRLRAAALAAENAPARAATPTRSTTRAAAPASTAPSARKSRRNTRRPAKRVRRARAKRRST